MTQPHPRSWRWLLIAGACLAVPLAVFLSTFPPPSPICVANLNRLRCGMERAEVERLLGGPPGDYRVKGTIYDAAAVVVPPGPAGEEELSLSAEDQWQGDGLLIVVGFDEEGKLRAAFGLLPVPPAWYRFLQRWLLLPSWHR